MSFCQLELDGLEEPLPVRTLYYPCQSHCILHNLLLLPKSRHAALTQQFFTILGSSGILDFDIAIFAGLVLPSYLQEFLFELSEGGSGACYHSKVIRY